MVFSSHTLPEALPMDLLRHWFGPYKHEVWAQLANEIGAQYEPDGFFKNGRVVVRHDQWTITLDTFVVSTGKSTHTYTRMRAPYVNPDGFRFRIYRKGFFSDLGKMLGMQDIEVGHKPFDEDFIIQGTDVKQVQALFANEQIRQLIAVQPAVDLSVRDDEGWFQMAFPQGVDELHFQVGGTIKDINHLKLLFDLFAETLEHLCRIGSAYEDDPKVVL
jgi:hypothetical protein